MVSAPKWIDRETSEKVIMLYNIQNYCTSFDVIIDSSKPSEINEKLNALTKTLRVEEISVDDRVTLSNHILKRLSRDQRIALAKALIQEQIVDQRNRLSHWSLVTAQSSMIDTGYIAQHLVSLQTQIAGQGMRGKGDDLYDGSEVKGANFLDSLDKKGAKGPRWNFTAGTIEILKRFLDYKAIFLVSIDLNPQNQYRVRIWKIDIRKHTILRERYETWMKRIAYPKFKDPKHISVNFQLFPPQTGTNDTAARHGRGGKKNLPKLSIPLENTEGATLVFRADVENGIPVISVF